MNTQRGLFFTKILNFIDKIEGLQNAYFVCKKELGN